MIDSVLKLLTCRELWELRGEQNISIHLIGRYLGNKFTMEIARGGGSSTPINSPFPLNIKALIWTMIEIKHYFGGPRKCSLFEGDSLSISGYSIRVDWTGQLIQDKKVKLRKYSLFGEKLKRKKI